MNAWTMSRALGCRPSEVYGIEHALRAYCFDSAVTSWGMALDAELDAAGKDAKDAHTAQRARDRVLRKWVPSTARYRDPAKE
jgi:hypothetical protein